MPLGLIILSALAALILFGAAQRVLDRMHLTDTQALVVLGLIFIGSFIDIPVTRGRTSITVNVGGALIPAILAVYVLVRAGTAAERTRAAVAALITAGAVWGAARITDFGPHGGAPLVLDPLWLFALVGGIVAYLLGRSRRAAFVAGVLGIVLFQLADVFMHSSATGGSASLALGGGGFFDAVLLSGIVSVGLAEIVGETRERLQGGPDPDRPTPLKQALSNDPAGAPAAGDAGARRENPPKSHDPADGRTGPANGGGEHE